MKLDASTIVFFTGMMFLSLTLVVYVEFRINRAYRGLGWWLGGTLTQAVGFLVMLTLAVEPIRFVSIAGNPLVVGGQAAIVIGICRFLGKKERIHVHIALFALFLAFYYYFIFFHNSITSRTVVISIFMALNALLAAVFLFRWKQPSFATSANFTAGIFTVYAFLEIIIGISTIGSPPIETYELTSQNAIRVVTFVIPILGSILWTYGITLMSNQRLNAENTEEREKQRMIFNLSPDAKLITRLEDGKLVDVNDAFLKRSGYTREELIGSTTLGIRYWEDPQDRSDYIAALSEKKAIDNKETIFRNKDGSTFTGLVSGRLLMIHDEPHLVSVVTDISEHKEIERKIRELLAEKETQYDQLVKTQEKLIEANEELARISVTDKLTGLFNRRKLIDVLDHEILRLARFGGTGTLVMADIDHFKEINDEYGHLTGDEILIHVAEILSSGIRKVDYCFRWGGEEFLLLLTETGLEEGLATAEKLRQKFERENLLPSGRLTISFGVATWRSGWDQAEWIQNTDTALYKAKNLGRNRVEG
jgi:diguanylate cyclase (GGDEF)-like protein/PAS domain S-box-containing protein